MESGDLDASRVKTKEGMHVYISLFSDGHCYQARECLSAQAPIPKLEATSVSFFPSLSPEAPWGGGAGGGKGGRITMSFSGSRLRRPALKCRSTLVCMFTGINANIIESANVTSSYYSMRTNGTQPKLREDVRGAWGEGQYV